MLSAALIPVAFAFIPNPMSTWQSGRCTWPDGASGRTGPGRGRSLEKFLMTTPPYSYGRGRRFFVPVWAWAKFAKTETRRATTNHFFMMMPLSPGRLSAMIQCPGMLWIEKPGAPGAGRGFTTRFCYSGNLHHRPFRSLQVTNATVVETTLSGLKLLGRGKVRDIYEVDGKLLLVASDRLSAFDV